MLKYEPISKNRFNTVYLLAGAFDPDEVNTDEIDHMYDVWWNFHEVIFVENSESIVDASDGSAVDYMYMWGEYLAEWRDTLEQLDVRDVRTIWANNLVELTPQQADALLIMAITRTSREIKNAKKTLEKYGE
jgi:hypothetical protein|tara:strand:+ start:2028 stop:2423 length:396 start_codon:yes stop_codon:yes gene_type:complete